MNTTMIAITTKTSEKKMATQKFYVHYTSEKRGGSTASSFCNPRTGEGIFDSQIDAQAHMQTHMEYLRTPGSAMQNRFFLDKAPVSIEKFGNDKIVMTFIDCFNEEKVITLKINNNG